MLRNAFVIFSLLFAAAISTSAQQNVSGIVKDSVTGKAVADVYIMLMNDDASNILAYSFSEENGAFSIDYPKTGQQRFLLVTSRLGYAPWMKRISRLTQKAEIRLRETSTQLKEIKITSAPIKQRGDTIDYFVSSFARPQDRTLADVLARMPGIEVQSDGRVQYGGKPINRFYIENMNLLEQRYSLATKNLSPDDIATVQVYENHEPVKMLRDRSNSEQAALNIKLKEGAKAKWLKTVEFGIGGFPFLYNATATLARFARGNQSLAVAKANNTGKDIFEELKMHALKPGTVFRPGETDGIPDQLSPISVATSFFTRDRARFNESAIASLNQLWKVREETDLRFNANYGFEREKRDRSVQTEYRIENQPSVVINNYTSQTVNWHKLENELAFTANRSAFYIEQKVNANIHWKDAHADILSNNWDIRQKMDLPRVHLKNNTSLKKLFGKMLLGIVNDTRFTRLPQSLTVSSPASLPLFTAAGAVQSVAFDDGYSNTYATLNLRAGRNTFDLKTGGEWVWQSLESSLEPTPAIDDESFANDLSWQSSRLYADVSHRFIYRSWTLNSSLTANYMQARRSGAKTLYAYVNPAVRVAYEPNASLKLNAGYSRRIAYGDLNQMQTGFIMKRYDLFSRGIGELQRNATQNLSWGATYKNILHFFNLFYIGSYVRYSKNLESANFIRDIYSFRWWELNDKTNSFLTNTLLATKLFTDYSLTAGLSLSYTKGVSSLRQQGAAIDYTNHSYSVSPSLKWNAKKNLNFDYTMNASLSGVSAGSNPAGKYIPLVDRRLYTFVGVSKKLSLNSTVQHFYNKSPDASVSNLVFADIGVQYLFPKMTVTLDCTNIFNRKQHVTSSYNAVNTVTRTDKLRPAEILLSFRFKP